jgi:alpha-tubulin suppressor-like RCC1 family protein
MQRARGRSSWLFLSFGLLAASAITIDGCNDTPPPEPAPQCKNGFRSQCITEASVGASFGCALLADRTVWCWGRNDQGQLGYPTTDLCPEDIGGGKTRSIACHTFPFQVVSLQGAVELHSGDAFSCAVLTDGTVRCWGDNARGQLGNGSVITSQSPVAVSSLSKVTKLALGGRHACALADGKVWCWGDGDQGQLGTKASGTCTADGGSIACAKQPVLVPSLDHVVELAAGAAHTCARLEDGSVTCWGNNAWGQLGLGNADKIAADKHDPVLVTLDTPLSGALSIAAGDDHTCALLDGGAVRCWGRDDHRELGGPPPGSGAVACSGPCSTLAIEVPGLPSTSPTIDDAGADATGDAGNEVGSDAGIDAPKADTGASSDASSDAKTDAIAGKDTAVEKPEIGVDSATGLGSFGRVLTSGTSFSCLRIDDGTVRCWGIDTVGQLGDGRTSSDPRGPTMVIASPGAAETNPLQGVARVRAGASSACAIMSDDSLRCWGSNQTGALGVGHFTPQQGPVPVSW